MHPIGSPAFEGTGPGLLRVTGSFTTDSTGAIIKVQRPTRNECTITRVAAGVYNLKLNQPAISVIKAVAFLGYTAAIIGTSGTVALPTTYPGNVNMSADFMTCDSTGAHFATDSTNSQFLILCYAAASNQTSLTLTDVYGLGNTSSVANYRITFEIQVATSTMNQ